MSSCRFLLSVNTLTRVLFLMGHDLKINHEITFWYFEDKNLFKYLSFYRVIFRAISQCAMKVIFKAFIVKVIHLSAKLFDYNFMVRTLLKSKLVCMNLYVYGIYNRSKNPKYLELFYVEATSSQLFI